MMNRFRILNKISYGYVISLGIVILGTASGLAIGDYYQKKAAQLETHADEEISLLHSLQASLLQERCHQQQLIPLADNPERLQQEYSQFLKSA